MRNPKISDLQVYPFDRKNKLFAKISHPITADLTIGEPQHAPDPEVIKILNEYASSSVGKYPRTKQEAFLTEAIRQSNLKSKKLSGTIADEQILAGCGSGELLYSFVSACLDPNKPYVLIPNPAYQVYIIATNFAGGIPYYFNLTKENNFQPNFSEIPENILSKTSLCYINNPNNPCAVCYTEDTLKEIISLAKKYNFAVASDECYIDIYYDSKPKSILEISANLDGNNTFKNVVAFDSLSKRSSLPGLRSGSMVGDAELVSNYLRLRLGERKVLPLNIQRASSYAWTNFTDVESNRLLYRAKIDALMDIFSKTKLKVSLPTGSFYCWLDISSINPNDEEFAFELANKTGILTFPGSYFSVTHNGINPGAGFIRIALIDELEKSKNTLKILAEYLST